MSDPDNYADTAYSDAHPDAEERPWAMLVHLSALTGFFIPFGNLVGPLVVWQLKKADMPFVDEQGKEALNFQITVSIAGAVCLMLMFILVGFLLLPVLVIGTLILTVLAGLKANQGVNFRYPVCWRLIT